MGELALGRYAVNALTGPERQSPPADAIEALRARGGGIGEGERAAGAGDRRFVAKKQKESGRPASRKPAAVPDSPLQPQGTSDAWWKPFGLSGESMSKNTEGLAQGLPGWC